MRQRQRFHAKLTQLAILVRDLAETAQTQARELDRLIVLLEQQTDLRDRPKDITVAASTITALYRQASQLVAELEEADEDND